MINSVFNRIILYARLHRANQKVRESLERLMVFLEAQNIVCLLDQETAQYFDLPLPTVDLQSMNKESDLIVVVGGDGSLLSAARMAVQVDVPIIGINRGRLGFLTDISPETIEEAFTKVLQGQHIEESRFLLNVTIQNDQGVCFEGCALNDIVIGKGDNNYLVEFDVFINQQFVSHYRADGVIFSTPTGSTAYALSAGGPIMHPGLQALVMVPMFSHSLSSRSMVIDANTTIDLKISPHNEKDLRLSCDGHESHTVTVNQQVIIKKHPQLLKLLHPIDYHYYDTLRVKLGWESRHQG